MQEKLWKHTRRPTVQSLSGFASVRSWPDNGSQFQNLVHAAIERAFGVKARHIPPGRPQANGLTEVYNRVFDSSHAGGLDSFDAGSACIQQHATTSVRHSHRNSIVLVPLG